MDASLKELTNMIRVSNPDARRRGTRFDFAVVFAETRSPGYRMREIGSVTAGRSGPDDTATLANKKFQIGDLIDVAITHPQRQVMRGGMRSRPYWRVRAHDVSDDTSVLNARVPGDATCVLELSILILMPTTAQHVRPGRRRCRNLRDLNNCTGVFVTVAIGRYLALKPEVRIRYVNCRSEAGRRRFWFVRSLLMFIEEYARFLHQIVSSFLRFRKMTLFAGRENAFCSRWHPPTHWRYD